MAASSESLARAGIMNSCAQVFSDVDGITSAARSTLPFAQSALNLTPWMHCEKVSTELYKLFT